MNTKAIKKTTSELEELIADSNASPEAREQAQTDIEKLQQWLDYYDWLNRLIDIFETKEILDFIPAERKKDQGKE